MAVIFGADGKSNVQVWGPLVGAEVKMDGIGGLDGEGCALIGFRINAQEIVDIRKCFNDELYLYALGNDDSRGAIELIFLVHLQGGKCDGQSSANPVKAAYESYCSSGRVSKKKGTVSVTVVGINLTGWVSGFYAGDVDPTTGTCKVCVSMIPKITNK